ncbi:phage gp6-like head-tail connector protein [Streptococcus infantis]|uniref:phage gp6-like head-tail connector protein n=1 Tax=Streptococcus infantis TaxID=68892 RepID=UPI0039C4B02F
MTSEVELHPLLKPFKERMRIFHSGEDKNLSRMLESSEANILSLVGSQRPTEPKVRELILERARYVYNDQVEFFYENFQGDLMALSLENYKVEEKRD